MEYKNETVRRKDRLLNESDAYELLRNGEYGVLSMQAENSGAYGIPVNYVWDGGKYIYIHCAPEGRKLRLISACPDVSFCVVGHTNVLSRLFTTEYESIVLSCKASIKLNADERKHALELILAKYSPHDKEVGLKYIDKSFHRTEIIRLDISLMTGKQKAVSR